MSLLPLYKKTLVLQQLLPMIAVLFLLMACSPAPPRQFAAGEGNLQVELHGFRNDRGQVIVSLFADEMGFPAEILLRGNDISQVFNLIDSELGQFVQHAFQPEIVDLDMFNNQFIFGRHALQETKKEIVRLYDKLNGLRPEKEPMSMDHTVLVKLARYSTIQYERKR